MSGDRINSASALIRRKAKFWIVLVCVNVYQDDQIYNLNYCANDCQELAEALKIANKEHQIEIVALYDGGKKQPLKDEVINSINKFGDAQPEDTILFYFSGHGYLDSNKQPVLCLADTQLEDLASTTLSINSLLNKFRESKANKQLIWLDACQEEVTDKLITVLEQQAQQSRKGQNFYAVLSCDKTERSWEFDELKHGVFTYYLIEGIKGKAANERGIIEAEKLFQYVSYHINKFVEYRQKPLVSSNSKCLTSKGLVVNIAGSTLRKDLPRNIAQNPRKIVSGSGDRQLVIGLATPPSQRQALIIDRLSASGDNIELCKILQARGGFAVDYYFLQESKLQNIRQVISGYLEKQNTKTLLLYLSGIISYSDRAEERLLITPEHIINLNWLGKQLQTSVIAEIIIICDRLETQQEIDLIKVLQPSKDKSICIITAASVKPNKRKLLRQIVTVLEDVRETEFWASELITRLQRWSSKDTDIELDFWLSGTSGVMEILLPEVQRSHNEVFEIDLCPYKSLEPFAPDDAYFFHGREGITKEIIHKLASTSFVAVVGASGSGKSSIVKAGVVPRLVTEGLFIEGKSQSCKTWVIRPTDWILFAEEDNARAALAKEIRPNNREFIEGILHLGVDSFVSWLEQQPQSISILVIDQFEELFTAAAIDRIQFLDLIVRAIALGGDKPDGMASQRFKVIITLRNDFLEECLATSQIAPLITSSTVLVSPCLTDAEYRQIITQPARKVGLKVEDELVDLLLQQLEAQNLPILQFVLDDLYYNRSNGCLSLGSYQQNIGELKGILGKKAQETYCSLNREQQECARWIFLSLVQLGEGREDTRRRLQRSELMVDKYKNVFDATLEALIEARLLVVSQETAIPESNKNIVTVEVAHEILIRNWDTLRGWLNENRSKLRLMRELEQKVNEWEQTHSSKKDGFLLSEAGLVKYEELYINNSEELPMRVHQFVGLSIDKRDRQAKEETARQQRELQQERKARKAAQRFVKTLVSGLLITLCLAGFAIWQLRKATINEINALSNSAELLSTSGRELDALVAGLKAGRRIQNSIFRVDNKIGFKVIEILQNIFYRIKEFNRLEDHHDEVRGVEFSPDGQIIASASYQNDIVELWDSQGNLLNTFQAHSRRVMDIEFSSDGQTIIYTGFDGIIKLWSLNLDEVVARGCDWARNYLNNNLKVSEEDRKICKGI